MGNKCVQKPQYWGGPTYNSKVECEKAMGLIIGPGGQQDSHPEHGSHSEHGSHPEHDGNISNNLPGAKNAKQFIQKSNIRTRVYEFNLTMRHIEPKDSDFSTKVERFGTPWLRLTKFRQHSASPDTTSSKTFIVIR